MDEKGVCGSVHLRPAPTDFCKKDPAIRRGFAD